jgi:hypothetical protein
MNFLMRNNDYGTKAEDFMKSKRPRPTITELVLFEKQKKEEIESGRPTTNS